ncbi:MAG: alkaline phosphatase D family protein [Pseudomonadota bacterium]
MVSPSIETNQSIHVVYMISTDNTFSKVIKTGAMTTHADQDYTVKVDVEGLEPNTQYYYRFQNNGVYSPIGRTRTLPVGHIYHITFAVVSCANYATDFFNVYREIAQRDIDYVLHLGDYIYEYGPGEYDDEGAVAQLRQFNPPREIISLDDYRTRYAQYRKDPALQELHAKRPFICVWDDHEVANDAYDSGAQNHNDNEGTFDERRAAALKAYYEWMPVRENPNDSLSIYRKFEFGNLINLYMLDTRLKARDAQLSHMKYVDNILEYDFDAADADIRDPDRELLGKEQMAWLQSELSASNAKWQVLGQQVLMGRMDIPWQLAAIITAAMDVVGNGEELDVERLLDLSGTDINNLDKLLSRKASYNLDAWDGYYAERESLFELIQSLDLNLINLAGDTHNAWANNLTNTSGDSIGVEFATASITSIGISEYLKKYAFPVPNLNEIFTSLVDDVQYANIYNRGFLILDVSHESANAEWVFVNTVKLPIYDTLQSASKRLQVLPGQGNRRIISDT